MSRLNPRRRWLAKQEATQKAILLTVKQEKSQVCDAERLQHGNVKSCVQKFSTSLALKAPREFWEGTGKRVAKVHTKPKASNVIIHGSASLSHANRIAKYLDDKKREG